MKKRDIKVIKKSEVDEIAAAVEEAASDPPLEKDPNVAQTIKGWIAERRENDEAEDRSRREKQFAAWDTDEVIPA